VASIVKLDLEKINEISRQLLSRIVIAKKNSDIEHELTVIEQVTEHEITDLMSQREYLIHNLFEQNSTAEMSLELNLLNEMIALDSELSKKSQQCKQYLAEHVIKFKKSKKASKSYQQY